MGLFFCLLLLQKQAGEYPWSRAGWHLGKRKTEPLVTGDAKLQELTGTWRKYLRQEDEKDTTEVIRKEISVSRTGWREVFYKEA